MLETLLKNEFLVMALDALLHLSSVAVLAVIVILACKLLSRAHVDAKLFTGLMVATLLVIFRSFLLNNIDRVLPGANGQILEIAMIIGLFVVCFILVYKLFAIPALGTFLSSIAIVIAQLSLANYIPQLSLRLMPEGQRFAEYAGLANDRTKNLMTEAKAFRGQSGGIKKILADALEAIQFFTSDEEQEQLSKDFASGMAVYKARKEYMDNMSPEELASYRKAMSEFLSEQGLAENRYSLSNLKNAKPEDLENLANFMKDMNKVYGFTDDLPEDGTDSEEPPPSAESLAQMAQSLSRVKMGGEDMAKLGSLFKDLGIDADSVMAGMAQARDDLAGIRDVTGRMVGEFKQLVPGELPSLPNAPTLPSFPSGEDVIQGEDVIVSGGYRIKKIPKAPNYGSTLFTADSERVSDPQMVEGEVAYFVPGSTMIISDDDMEVIYDSEESVSEAAQTAAIKSNYFKPEELNPITTEQSIVMVPIDTDEAVLWREASATIAIDAWFSTSDELGYSTIFIQGNALQDGDIFEHAHADQVYRFKFNGIEEGLITLVSLERVDLIE